MRILITGAAGFIGFHLARKLKALNHFVIGLDNFNSYYDVALKEQRRSLLSKEGIEIIKADVQKKAALKVIFEKYQITHVVHLAAQAGVRHSLLHPEEYLASNIQGFLSLLEALKFFPKTKTVYASSSSVYGLNKKTPFSTDDVTDSPANFYGATKKAGELMAHAYHHLFGLKLIGLRFFTVYGPWGRPDMAYFKFAKHILEKKPIEVFNHGKMQRDFTYIDDIVEGIISALKSPLDFGLFNLGNNQPASVLDLISIIEKGLGKKALLKLMPMQKGEVLTTYADISKSQKDLHFQPTTSLEKGMAKFLDWFTFWHQEKNNLKTSGSDSIRSEAIIE